MRVSGTYLHSVYVQERKIRLHFYLFDEKNLATHIDKYIHISL